MSGRPGTSGGPPQRLDQPTADSNDAEAQQLPQAAPQSEEARMTAPPVKRKRGRPPKKNKLLEVQNRPAEKKPEERVTNDPTAEMVLETDKENSAVGLLETGEENMEAAVANAVVKQEIEEKPEISSCHTPVAEKFNELALNSLYSDLLPSNSGTAFGNESKQKKIDAETWEKIDRIGKAIDLGCDQIVSFEFFSISTPSRSDADVTIYLVLFKGPNQEVEVRTVFTGRLNQTKKVGKNIAREPIKNDSVQAVYLVAEARVEAIERDRRTKTETVTVQSLYGVKPVGRLNDDHFAFLYANSGVHMISEEQKSLHAIHFKLANLEDWMKSPDRLAEVSKVVQAYARRNETTFVSFETSEEHDEELWEEVEEKHLFQKEFEAGPFSQPIRYVEMGEDGELQTLATAEYGKCPLTFKEYSDLEQHVQAYKSRFSSLTFQMINPHTVVVTLRERRDQITTAVGGPKVKGPPADRCLSTYKVHMEPVPWKTGKVKGQDRQWYSHRSDVDWLKTDMERRIRGMVGFPKSLIPFSIMVNNWLLKEPFSGPTGTGRRLMRFFQEREQEIMEKASGLYAVMYAQLAFKNGFLEADEFKAVFDQFTALLQAEQEKKEKDRPSTTE